MCQCQTPTEYRFSFNLAAATIREHGGRGYYVLPMVLLTEGVHAGSHGPLFYSANELERNPSGWDLRPITLGHPQNAFGVGEAFNEVKHARMHVGFVFNTKYDSKKKRLVADAWIDVEKAREVDPRIEEAVAAGRQMEVSTGLMHDADETEGIFNGVGYQKSVRNIRPDHLALLPDMVGACSLAKGCGLLRNEGVWPEPSAPWVSKEEWGHQHVAPLAVPTMNYGGLFDGMPITPEMFRDDGKDVPLPSSLFASCVEEPAQGLSLPSLHFHHGEGENATQNEDTVSQTVGLPLPSWD